MLGAEHPDTLTSMNNLAFTWKEQGRDADTLRLMEYCVQLRARILGLIGWQAEKLEIDALTAKGQIHSLRRRLLASLNR